MVRRWWREPGEDLAHERFLGLAQERRPLPDFLERRADGPAVKRHGLARMSRQDDGLWRKCDQALQGRAEHVSAVARLRHRRLEIRTTDSRQEQRVASEQGPLAQQIAGALRRMARRVKHPET